MRILLLLLMAMPGWLCAQSFNGLKGSTFKNEQEVALLQNCIRTAEKEDTGGYVCVVYQDTVKEVCAITIQRERQGSFTVLALLEVEAPRKGYEMIAGIGERRESEAGYTFVVSIERIPEGNSSALATNKVKQAWAFNNNSKKFEELKARKVTRIGESYMWK